MFLYCLCVFPRRQHWRHIRFRTILEIITCSSFPKNGNHLRSLRIFVRKWNATRANCQSFCVRIQISIAVPSGSTPAALSLTFSRSPVIEWYISSLSIFHFPFSIFHRRSRHNLHSFFNFIFILHSSWSGTSFAPPLQFIHQNSRLFYINSNSMKIMENGEWVKE